jgi:hypothetical protein
MENAPLPPPRSVTVSRFDRPPLAGYHLLPDDGSAAVEATRRRRPVMDRVPIALGMTACVVLFGALYAWRESILKDAEAAMPAVLVAAVALGLWGPHIADLVRARLEHPWLLHRSGQLLASWRTVGRNRRDLTGPDGQILCRMRRRTLWTNMHWLWCFEAADGRLLLRYETRGSYSRRGWETPKVFGSEWMYLAIEGEPPVRFEYQSEDDELGLAAGFLCVELYHTVRGSS